MAWDTHKEASPKIKYDAFLNEYKCYQSKYVTAQKNKQMYAPVSTPSITLTSIEYILHWTLFLDKVLLLLFWEKNIACSMQGLF